MSKLNINFIARALIEYWRMDGYLESHNDFLNDRLCLIFNFRNRYLCVRDFLYLDRPIAEDKIILHVFENVAEIKQQFDAYFNAIWC